MILPKMTLEELFKSDISELPRSGFSESSTTFDAFLADIFGRYIAELRKLDDPAFSDICSDVHASIDKAEKLASQIVLAVKDHLSGYPSKAFNQIHTALGEVPIKCLFSNVRPFVSGAISRSDLETLLNCIESPPLYRVRTDREAAATSRLSRKDIFHVPFEKRHLVHNQRYSIAGLPCLYLGSSIWVCWEELGRPELDTVLVSRFALASSAQVLDFQFPPAIYWGVYSYFLRELAAHATSPMISDAVFDEFKLRFSRDSVAGYLICWPLIAACSIKVDSRKGAFFPHYIVPQLLLQWVTGTKVVDGIRYFSTRVPTEDANAYSNSNCVFPARNITQAGLCTRLNALFNLTSPIPWDMLQATDLGSRFTFGPSNAQSGMRLSDDVFVRYNTTEFFSAEQRLEMFESEGKFSRPAIGI